LNTDGKKLIDGPNGIKNFDVPVNIKIRKLIRKLEGKILD
jgi:hypothetical protein